MTILKFLIKPIKLLLFLSVLAALVYFRSIIFQPYINQYVDAGLSFVEDIADISIPSHPAPVAKAKANDVKVVAQDACKSDELKVAEAEPVGTVVSVKDDVNKIEDAVVVTDEPASDIVAAVIDDTSTKTGADPDNGISTVDVEIAADEKADALVEAGNNKLASSVIAQEAAVIIDDLSESNIKENNSNEVQEAIILTADDSVVDADQLLMTARQLFWNSDTGDAEKTYLDLIKIDDSNADIYGELGNVYYSQGKWKQAGEAYYEAAVRLLASEKDGQNVNRVSYLLRVIQGLDRESAEKLKNKISG